MINGGRESIFVGAMSGTSMDGLDLAAVTFPENHKPVLHYSRNSPYPSDLKKSLLSMALDSNAILSDMCELDTRLGQFYATEIDRFISEFSIPKSAITAIGSHGQTLRHRVQGPHPYTLQIGDPNIIAAHTGVTVVADFRRRDVALGGQGAPLAPAFHQQIFRSDSCNRAIINIGGIANITSLYSDPTLPVLGFDTGPGNTLMDYVCREFLNTGYDDRGKIAASGHIHHSLLQTILQQEPYFQSPLPKSTGTDYFSPAWLERSGLVDLSTTDQLATLADLTAISITQGIHALPMTIDECYVCGGGAHNVFLLDRLAHHLADTNVSSTGNLGIDPDWVEAIAFAWLAKQTLNHQPGNLPSVTNAQKFTILGAVYYSHRKS